jgi:ClpP class serine protease
MDLFITSDAFAELQRADEIIAALPAHEVAKIAAAVNGAPGTTSARGYSAVDGVAHVAIAGPLFPARNALYDWFGVAHTAYTDVRAGIAQANADAKVNEIVLDVNSPGGSVAGMFETMEAIAASGKPVRAQVRDVAASAAYALASQAGEIVADHRASTVGSVGILQVVHVDPETVAITSTEAPNKAPDVTTEAGVAAVREHLDAWHELMVGAIAAGRGTTADNVNASYGRGGVLLADAALEAGMIDGIKSTQTTSGPEALAEAAISETSAGEAGNNREDRAMNLEQLKAEHPALFASVVAIGEQIERERVEAHLTMGEAYGAMGTAIEAVKSGADLSPKLQAEYMAAGAKSAAGKAREADDAAVAVAADDATVSDDNGAGVVDADAEAGAQIIALALNKAGV